MFLSAQFAGSLLASAQTIHGIVELGVEPREQVAADKTACSRYQQRRHIGKSGIEARSPERTVLPFWSLLLAFNPQPHAGTFVHCRTRKFHRPRKAVVV